MQSWGNKYTYKFRIRIVINVLAICQILNILWHFEIFVDTGPYEGGARFQNATLPTVFIRCEPMFMINKAVTGEYKVINELAKS